MLVATIPETPAAIATSTASSRASGARSGASFTSSGLPGRPLREASDARAQEPVERGRLLQLAQPRRVRRRDVHDEVVGVRVEPVDAGEVVRDRLLVRRHLVLPDVDADRPEPRLARQGREPGRADLRPLVVEAPSGSRARGAREAGRGAAGRSPPAAVGVMVPISTWEKPSPNSPATATSPLSNPAARPIGESNSSPRTFTARAGERHRPAAPRLPRRHAAQDAGARGGGRARDRAGTGASGVRARASRASLHNPRERREGARAPHSCFTITIASSRSSA